MPANYVSYDVGYYLKLETLGTDIETALCAVVLPGTIPAVRVPYFTVILADGMILIPQDTVLAETHLALPVELGFEVQ